MKVTETHTTFYQADGCQHGKCKHHKINPTYEHTHLKHVICYYIMPCCRSTVELSIEYNSKNLKCCKFMFVAATAQSDLHVTRTM